MIKFSTRILLPVFTFLFIIMQTSLLAQLSGTITLHPDGSGDYPGLQEAVDDLAEKGISGEVMISLSPGTYEGSIIIKNIPGTQADRRVVIGSSTNNPSDVILKDSLVLSGFGFNLGHIKLEYVDFLTIQNLTIETIDLSGIGSSITFFGGNDGIVLKGNIIEDPDSRAYGSLAVKYLNDAFQGSDLTPQDLHILGNTINGVLYFYVNDTTFRMKNLLIGENTLINTTISLSDLESFTIRANEFTTGINQVNINLAGNVGQNLVYGNTFSGGEQSIFVNRSPGELQISNNFFNTAYVGVFLSNARGVKLYYNSFRMYGDQLGVAAVHIQGSENNEFLNNIFEVAGKGSGYFLRDGTFDAGSRSDYNNYFIQEGGIWTDASGFPYVDFQALTDIQTTFGNEVHGLNINPFYYSETDLHIAASGLSGKAIPISGILYDIDGELRDPVAPDIGADEMSLPPNITLDSVKISPSVARGEDNISISWWASNSGSVDINSSWTDQVFLSSDKVLGGDDILIGSADFEGSLPSGSTYKLETETAFSQDTAGTYYFIVKVNAFEEQAEDPADNVVESMDPLIYTPRDRASLIVDEIIVPEAISSGTEITISWKVSNYGQISTMQKWVDRVFLSTDSLYLQDPIHFNPDSGFIMDVESPAGLNVGESYNSTASFYLPLRGSGKYYIKILTDATDLVDEVIEDHASKGLPSTAISVSQVPIADLVITGVTVPDRAFSGEWIDLVYTVKNIGNAATALDRRRDFIYMYYDSLEVDERLRRYKKVEDFYNSREILPDSSRTISVRYKMPYCESAIYKLFFLIDGNDNIFELSEVNNAYLSNPLEVVMRPNPDFVIENFNLTTAAPMSGQQLTFDYSVKNDGFSEIQIFNNLLEGIFLSKSDVLDEEKLEAKSRPFDFDTLQLEVGGSVERSRTLFIPDSVFGSHYLFVRADNPDQFCEVPYEENNLYRYGPFEIKRSPARDLVVTDVSISPSEEAGKQVHIAYTLRNLGEGALTNILVSDSLALFNGEQVYHLGDFEAERSLLPGGDVEVDKLISLPLRMDPGNYALSVYTDLHDKVYEHNAEDNNTGISETINVTRNTGNLAELVLDDIDIQSLESGTNLNVSYSVTNTSDMETPLDYWVDRLLLLDANGVTRYEAQVLVNESLAKNESYNGSISLYVPVHKSGTYTLVLIADGNEEIVEYNEENNVYTEEVTIELKRWADLKIQDVSHPDILTAGQEMQIAWTSLNTGSRDTESEKWVDKVFLSENNVFNDYDIPFGSVSHDGKLLVSDAYSADTSIRVPQEISGMFYLIVYTDQGDQVFENHAIGNNIYISSERIEVKRPAPVDLVPEVISVSAFGNSVKYRINNNGTNPASGSWTDAVYLSKDAFLDSEDLLVDYHEVRLTEDLLPGTSVEMETSGGLPVVKPGDYYLLVRSDIYNYIPETSISNNVAAPDVPLFIDQIEDLVPGVSTDTLFKHYSKNHYYELEKKSGKGILLSLSAQDRNSVTDLYYRTEDVPTAGGLFDFRGNNPLQTNQKIIVPSADSTTTDYILAEADYLDADFVYYSILAEEKEFSIVDVNPKKGGNEGIVVIDLEGFDFTENSSVFLRNEADTTEAVHTFIINSTLARAHVNTNYVSPGLYDVVLKRPDKGDETVFPGAFTVEDSSYHEYYVEVVVPEGIRIFREASLQVNYANLGNINDYDVFLYISFYRSGFKTDSFDIDYLGDGIIDRLPPEARLYHAYGKEAFIKDDRAIHFIAWFPVLAAGGRGQFTFNLSGSVEDTVFIATKFFRNDISQVHFSGDLDDLKSSEFMKDFTDYINGEYDPTGTVNQIKAAKGECQTDPAVVEAMIWKGVRSHAEYVSGGIPGNPANVVATLLQEGLKSYIDPDAHTSAEGMAKDLTDPRREIVLDPTQKSAYDHLIRNLDACLTPEIRDEIRSKCIRCDRQEIERLDGRKEYKTVCTNNCKEGKPPPGKSGTTPTTTTIRKPKDPNDITGPAGIGGPRFVVEKEILPYRIRFENVPDATAPAQIVRIENDLNEEFNIKRFRLHQIGWGDTVINLPVKPTFSGSFELGEKYLNHQLKVVAGIDPVNHKAFWSFTTIDPQTGNVPDNPGSGFLPPNDSLGIGEGFVSYTIAAEEDLPSGTRIENQAVIVFDEESSLNTNLWSNTVAGSGTESFVNELPAEIDTSRFIVSWDYLATEDFAPRPVSYSIFVSQDDEPYVLWIDNTQEVSAIFTGELGAVYRFFSMADFSDGSTEEVPDVADAMVTIVERQATEISDYPGAVFGNIAVYPNPSSDELNIIYHLKEASGVHLAVYDLAGRILMVLANEDQAPGEHRYRIARDYGKMEAGVYIIRFSDGRSQISRRWIKN